MNFNEFKESVAAAADAAGLEEYELYYQTDASTSVDTFQGAINEFSSSLDGGVCFRAIVNGKMGYASTEDLSEEEARAVVARAMDNASVLEAEEQVFLGEGGQSYEPLNVRKIPLPTTDHLIEKTLEAQKKVCEADPRVMDVSQSQGLFERSEIAIFNSKGLDLHYENTVAGLIAVAVVSDGKEMASQFKLKLDDLDQIDLDDMAKKAADSAILQLGGDVAPTGVYPVIFNPEAMSSLLGTFCGIFSSETAQKGLSKLQGQEGQVIASPEVTLVDDPFYPENPMPINFDAEGSPAHRKNVIEKGILNTLLYNLTTASVAGKKTTGNASKGGYSSPVGISPFTMYLAPGALSEDELLSKAGHGVYITSLGGLHAGANPVTGDFSLQSSGFMIENGKKAGYVKSFTVAGNFYDLLKKITAVASNLELPNAMGKTAFGSPSVLVDNLSVAGK